MASVKEVLDKAADLLSVNKWGRGYAESRPKDTMCLMEAVDTATGGDIDMYYEAERVIYDLLGQPTTVWNDEVAKSKRQVISVLRKAAKAAEGTTS